MRDLNLSAMINVVAAGSLLVSTTGCSTYKKAAKKACKALQECQPMYFNEYYGALDVCVSYWESEFEYTELDYGKSCAKAQAKYFICAGKEMKRSCNQTAVTFECAEEYARAYVECVLFDYYYGDT